MTTKITKISQIAKEKPNEVFTSIYHLINKELLEECFNELNGNKVIVNKEESLENLLNKLKDKSYKPCLIRFEDKIVQLALKKIIEAIYEPKFADNMFGFRPNKSCHDALRKISFDIERQNTNYIVKVDIKSYFENINHDKLIECLKLHIQDTNIIKLVRNFLKAGILEKDKFKVGEYGISQGSILSPVLVNVYMYYFLIMWFEDIIKNRTKGFTSIINYADDFICCFQYKKDADMFYKYLLPNRLIEGGLEFALDKIRIIEFGRFAILNCKSGKPKTFDFMGFTHYCSISNNGKFRVKRKTSSKSFRKQLSEFNVWCKENRNLELDKIMIIFKKKLINHYNYYGIVDNYYMIKKYQWYMYKTLFKWLNRRSQRKSYTWKEFQQIVKKYNIPKNYICINIYDKQKFDQ